MPLGTPATLFTATAAGATLAKTLWPGTYTLGSTTLPSARSGSSSTILSGSSVIGGVIAAEPGTSGLILDFAGVGGADLTLVVEIGKLNADGAMAMPIASVSLKSITTSGTIANVNPFTGAVVASTTFRLFDLATLTNYGNLDQLTVNVGGTENNLPVQLVLTTEEGQWYYFIVTSLGTLTSAICVVTPTSARADRLGAPLGPLTAGSASIGTVETELPAAAALADAASNPTAPAVGADLQGFNGATWDRVRLPNVSKDVNGVSITTIATVWTPASGKKFRLMGGSISSSVAGAVLFEDNAAGAGNFVFRTPKLAADTPYDFVVPGNGYLSAAANNVLKATLASATITGTLYGTEEL